MILVNTDIAKRKGEAEIALLDAQRKETETATAKTVIDIRYGKLIAAAQAQGVRMGLKQEEDMMASDRFHHVYSFTDMISSASVAACMARLDLWHRTSPGCAIEISFTSPGGDVIEGLALFDYILYMRRLGHKVTTSALGWAASMAGILLQAGTVRIMHKEAWVLIHEIRFGTSGKIGDIEDTTEWFKRVQDRVVNIFAERCKTAMENGTASEILTAEEIKQHWLRKDWWLSSDECLKYGLVDEVR